MLDWFLDALDPRVVNLVSATLFAMASLVVCVVAIRLAHIKNYGWPPILLQTGQRSHVDEETGLLTLEIEFALCNRRTYPILVRHSEVRFRGMRLEPNCRLGGWSANARRSRMSFTDPRQIFSNSQYALVAAGTFRVKNPQRFRPRFRIAVHYFDPMRNKVTMTRLYGAHDLE